LQVLNWDCQLVNDKTDTRNILISLTTSESTYMCGQQIGYFVLVLNYWRMPNRLQSCGDPPQKWNLKLPEPTHGTRTYTKTCKISAVHFQTKQVISLAKHRKPQMECEQKWSWIESKNVYKQLVVLQMYPEYTRKRIWGEAFLEHSFQKFASQLENIFLYPR